jgi:hypothetical protein
MPFAVQTIIWLAGSIVIGVQVKTVFPLLQAGEVVSTWEVLVSITMTVVAMGFIASLKVRQRVVLGETPLAMCAGTDERIVGVPRDIQAHAREPLSTSSFSSRLCIVSRRGFIVVVV